MFHAATASPAAPAGFKRIPEAKRFEKQSIIIDRKKTEFPAFRSPLLEELIMCELILLVVLIIFSITQTELYSFGKRRVYLASLLEMVDALGRKRAGATKMIK